MHHQAVLLPCGDMLIYGGRTAPRRANSYFYLCSLSASDKVMIKKLHLSSSIPGRWRHTMTLISIKGMTLVLICLHNVVYTT